MVLRVIYVLHGLFICNFCVHTISSELVSNNETVTPSTSSTNETCPMECDNGYCEDRRCMCFLGYSGIKCNMEKCGIGVCEQTLACIRNQECCSIVGCQPPLLLGNLDVGGNEGLPPLAFVGIGLCCVVGMILVAAMVMYHPCCAGNRQATRASKYTINTLKDSTGTKRYKSGISSFVPAADVTSVDFIGDVTAEWIRTESNALAEAPGVMLPYTGVTDDKSREAWEPPTQRVLHDDTVSLPSPSVVMPKEPRTVKSRAASEHSGTKSKTSSTIRKSPATQKSLTVSKKSPTAAKNKKSKRLP